MFFVFTAADLWLFVASGNIILNVTGPLFVWRIPNEMLTLAFAKIPMHQQVPTIYGLKELLLPYVESCFTVMELHNQYNFDQQYLSNTLRKGCIVEQIKYRYNLVFYIILFMHHRFLHKKLPSYSHK